MANVLTEKYGPLPGWAWGGIAVVGGLIVFARSRQQAAGQQAGMPAVSPAASAVPFVPSVTVTGIPPTASAAGTPPTPGTTPMTTSAIVTGIGSNANGTQLRNGPNGFAAMSMFVPGGATLQVDPNPVNGWYKVIGGQGTGLWAWAQDLQITSQGGGGRGGYGLAGQAQPASTPMFGWTAGWMPEGMAQRIGGMGGGTSPRKSATATPSHAGGRGAAPYVHTVLLGGFGGGLQEQGRRLGQGGGRSTLHPNRPAGQRAFRLFARR